MAAGQGFVQASIVAQNTFTDAMDIKKGERFALSISGRTDSTAITFQRLLDGANWRDVKQYTADTEEDGVAPCNCQIRLGIKTGDYGTDTVVCRIQK